jgi:Family of unknown function (DUF6152)
MKLNTMFAISAIAFFTVTPPALAHHSFAMFDSTKTITLTGTVKEFEWVNPHSWIRVLVENAAGMPEEWAFEMGSPGQLAAGGWKKDSLKVGDVVTISARPMKDGSRGGSGGNIKNADGVCVGRCNRAADAPPADDGGRAQ